MSLPRRTLLRAAAWLGAGCLLPASLLAQASTNPPALTHPDAPFGAPAAVMPPMPPGLSPALPLARSPITFFRELLAMTAPERRQVLTNYPSERQKQILDKVREYELLKPNDRELRLRVTELHWYLRPLMVAPAANRAAQLAAIPEPNRSLLQDRLAEWDKLPADVRKELLGLEPTLQYFAELGWLSPQQREQILSSVPAPRRKLLEKGLQQWDAMSEEQQRRTLSRFNQFFDLTSTEKEKALKTLSEPERQQIEKTLQAFEKLPATQRVQCLRSFGKFASLSVGERQQFLKNAERWEQMSPTERQAWRQLVTHLPPPLPRLRPPLPPPLPRTRPAPVVVTNGN
jgi:hypothetical protein